MVDCAAVRVQAPLDHLDPMSGSSTGDGSATYPWPGLAEVIEAGVMDQVPAGATLVLHNGLHGYQPKRHRQ
jgi:hypothetical protein